LEQTFLFAGMAKAYCLDLVWENKCQANLGGEAFYKFSSLMPCLTLSFLPSQLNDIPKDIDKTVHALISLIIHSPEEHNDFNRGHISCP